MLILKPNQTLVTYPAKLQCLYDDSLRNVILYGGRGGAKSRGIATSYVAKAYTQKKRFLCTRQFQNSIGDSVHRLLSDEIERQGLQPFFRIRDNGITSWTGSEFIFKGLQRQIGEIKSLEGIDECWVEEAQRVTAEGWEHLLPTIRKKGSRVTVSFNPEQREDATPTLWLGSDPPPRTHVQKVGWQDNPWFTEELEEQRRHMLAKDPDAYDHVWEGNFRKITEAVIFRGKYEVRAFDTPAGVRFYFGADWGFSNDPTCLIRCFIIDNMLYIDYESFGYGVDFPELPQLFERIPGAREWPIKADCARPESISYMARMGFNISAAEKWAGSLEDGIAHLRGFDKIVIHERCIHMATEARLYSYKVDKRQLDDKGQPVVLPIIVDAHNHGWDAVRYGLDGYIKKRGNAGMWEGLLD